MFGLVTAILKKNALKKVATSMELSDIVDSSVTEAVQLVEELNVAAKQAMIWTWLTVVLAVLLFAAVGYHIMKKRQPEAAENAPSQEPVPENSNRDPEHTDEESEN